jgi:CDP-diacylglycerol--glycerol-3-phosphate 3-phosphatidyltransferase
LTDTLATVPNLITLSRIMGILPVMWLIHAGADPKDAWLLWVAVVLMAISEISDWLDGWLARRMRWVSRSGKVLDPMADSIYRISVFVALVANGWVPLWVVLIMAARDLCMSEVRLLAQRANVTLAARPVGKFRAALQGVAQFAIVFAYAIGGGVITAPTELLVHGLLYIALAVTIWSVFDYAAGVGNALRRGGSMTTTD